MLEVYRATEDENCSLLVTKSCMRYVGNNEVSAASIFYRGASQLRGGGGGIPRCSTLKTPQSRN
jgi:hypothetical protein